MIYEVAKTNIKQNRYLQYDMEWEIITKSQYIIYKYIYCYKVRKRKE